MGTQSEAEDQIVQLMEGIARGIFYPPANNEWRDAYGSLVWESPESGIDEAWLADQEARRQEIDPMAIPQNM
jgi:hypothetical protein